MESKKIIKKERNIDRRLIQFINFLKDNDAFNSFVYELGVQKSLKFYSYLSKFIKKNETLLNAIDCAFTWSDTKEGFEHWCSLSEDWDSFCHYEEVTYNEPYIIEQASYEISRF
jgi:hypothetical protein